MDLNTIAISIIVPIYNAEKFLEKTIKSVLNQSFKSFELLLVIDGSTDQSEAICNNYTKLDQRVKLICKKNGGVSSARNEGVKNASGEYIYHLDADDLLLESALSNLYACAIEKDADITIANYIVRNSFGDTVIQQKPCYTSEDFLKKMLMGDYHAALWNKLVKTKIYKGISFDEDVNCMEDKLFFTQVLLKNPSLFFLDKEIYVYIQREDSLTNNITSKTMYSIERVIKSIENLLSDQIIFLKCINKLKLDFKIKLLINSNDKKKIVMQFSEVNKGIFYNKLIPLHYRILLGLECYNISFITKIFKRIKHKNNNIEL